MATKTKVMFMPKAKQREVQTNGSAGHGSTSKPPPRVRPKPNGVKSEDEKVPSLVDEPGTFTDYKILTHDPNGRKYNVMKFDSRRPTPINPNTWPKPVKLNRKNPNPLHSTEEVEERNLSPMLGPDGKPVIGPDGKIVMVTPDGKPANLQAKAKAVPGKGGFGKRMPFKKKTRQVIPIPEEQRQAKKEERYPWVLEDASGQEVWVGKLDDVTTKSTTHAFFMPMGATPQVDSDHFLFVPAHRWYKFQKRPHYRTLGLEEAEEEVRFPSVRD